MQIGNDRQLKFRCRNCVSSSQIIGSCVPFTRLYVRGHAATMSQTYQFSDHYDMHTHTQICIRIPRVLPRFKFLPLQLSRIYLVVPFTNRHLCPCSITRQLCAFIRAFDRPSYGTSSGNLSDWDECSTEHLTVLVSITHWLIKTRPIQIVFFRP